MPSVHTWHPVEFPSLPPWRMGLGQVPNNGAGRALPTKKSGTGPLYAPEMGGGERGGCFPSVPGAEC